MIPPRRSDPAAATPAEAGPPGAASSETGPLEARRPRPLLERLGLAAIALVMGSLFAVVAIAGWSGGEPFLAVMGALGALMTLWAGGLTLFRR